ncbi:MAG: CvpA family protein [Chitinophagaceae bacterium]|nr:CvpA family protein [Chitinophagaceae bacterium]
MHIDILFLIAMAMAIIKGLRQGLIVALFSALGWIIGLAAALKLSAVAAGYLEHSLNTSSRWIPVLSFAAVFIIVMLLVRLGAGILQKTIELGMMGWTNRIGGIILYVLLYAIIFSIILFYAEQLKLINEETMASSRAYAIIKPLGPLVIDGIGAVIPVFKGLFAELQTFFEGVAERIPAK